MKNYLKITVFLLVFGIGINYLFDYFGFFYQPQPPTKTEKVKCIPVEAAADISLTEEKIEEEAPRKIISEPIHSNLAWLMAEEIANNNSSAMKLLKETAPADTTIAKYRKQAYDLRVKMIKLSRERYLNPQSAWGDFVTDTLGIEPNSVLMFTKGIAIKVKRRFQFFHKAAIERNLVKSKIAVMRGKDGYWYPAIEDEQNRNIPLTYWGEIN